MEEGGSEVKRGQGQWGGEADQAEEMLDLLREDYDDKDKGVDADGRLEGAGA